MNESINVTSTNSSTASVSGKSQAVKAASGGENGTEAADALDNKQSFSESLSKVNERTDTEKHDSSAKDDGNSLPFSAESSDQVAEDDHESLAIIIEKVLNHSEQTKGDATLQNSQATEAQNIVQSSSQLLTDNIYLDTENTEKTLAVDAKLKGNNNSGQLSSLQSALQNLASNIAKGEATKTSTKLENTNAGKLDLSQLDLDNQDVTLDKKIFSGLMKQAQYSLTGSQPQPQNILNEIQGVLSQRLDSAPVSARIDTLGASSIQAANTSPLNMSTSPLMAEVKEPFGRPSWSQAMNSHVVLMANQNIKSAEIRLNPVHLGPVEVRLEISDDQINVALSSRHAAVREAMEMAMPKLREMLENDGLNLSDSNISHQSFAEQREQNDENKSTGIMSSPFTQVEQGSAGEDTAVQQTVSTSMVDYFI